MLTWIIIVDVAYREVGYKSLLTYCRSTVFRDIGEARQEEQLETRAMDRGDSCSHGVRYHC